MAAVNGIERSDDDVFEAVGNALADYAGIDDVVKTYSEWETKGEATFFGLALTKTAGKLADSMLAADIEASTQKLLKATITQIWTLIKESEMTWGVDANQLKPILQEAEGVVKKQLAAASVTPQNQNMKVATALEVYFSERDAAIGWEDKKAADKLIKSASETVVTTLKKLDVEKDRQFLVFDILDSEGIFRMCLTDDLRRLVIRYHARSVPTATTIDLILDEHADVTPFSQFIASDACGYKQIKDFLVSRLGYLKISHPRFPKQKYGQLWQEEYEEYVDQIKGIPLTAPAEQAMKLSDHFHALEQAFSDARTSVDKARYHKCMMQTLITLNMITRDPSIVLPKPLSPAESATKALPTPADTSLIEIPEQAEQQSLVDTD